MKKELADNGVIGNFCVNEEEPTGKCGVVVVNNERALLAHLAAACKYDINHLRQNMEAL